MKVKNIFRGREVTFPSKGGVAFNMEDEEERALFHFWKDMYGFIQPYEKEGR